MRIPFSTNQFKRDYKRHCLDLLTFSWAEIFWKLLTDQELPEKYKDHQLTGNLKEFRDCHIKPDLVLIYRKYDDVLQLVRLGSHSELDL